MRGFLSTISRGRRERLPHLVTERCGFSYEAKLAKRLSTRRVRLARMILIQAIRNAVVNDLVVRNVADLAAIALARCSRAPERQTEAKPDQLGYRDRMIRLMSSRNRGD